jgi:hypothetical protein
LLVVQNSFMLSMWVHGAPLVDIWKACCHTKEFVQ